MPLAIAMPSPIATVDNAGGEPPASCPYSAPIPCSACTTGNVGSTVDIACVLPAGEFSLVFLALVSNDFVRHELYSIVFIMTIMAISAALSIRLLVRYVWVCI